MIHDGLPPRPLGQVGGAHSQALETGPGTPEGPSFGRRQRDRKQPTANSGRKRGEPGPSTSRELAGRVSRSRPLPGVGSLRLPSGTAEKPTLRRCGGKRTRWALGPEGKGLGSPVGETRAARRGYETGRPRGKAGKAGAAGCAHDGDLLRQLRHPSGCGESGSEADGVGGRADGWVGDSGADGQTHQSGPAGEGRGGRKAGCLDGAEVSRGCHRGQRRIRVCS